LELPTGKAPGDTENTPLTLHLVWRVESADQVDAATTAVSSTQAGWITRAKLVELGVPVPSRFETNTFVSTLLVLEFDGPTHARVESRTCSPASRVRDETICDFEARKSSRLYVVDAGRTVAELRGRYPDRAHFAIVPGVIKLAIDRKVGEVAGYISGLSVDTVQGVEPLRSTIDPSTGEMLWHRLLAPHVFEAVISFGRRLEPWNVSIEGRENSSNPD
jgi:hypothetical protein